MLLFPPQLDTLVHLGLNLHSFVLFVQNQHVPMCRRALPLNAETLGVIADPLYSSFVDIRSLQ